MYIPGQCVHNLVLFIMIFPVYAHALTGMPVFIHPDSVDPRASSHETPPIAVDVPTSSHQPQSQLGEDHNTVRVLCKKKYCAASIIISLSLTVSRYSSSTSIGSATTHALFLSNGE